MISISVNGHPESVENGISIVQLLALLGLADKRVAVELNRAIVPKSLHAQTHVGADDRIEIVNAIGGG